MNGSELRFGVEISVHSRKHYIIKEEMAYVDEGFDNLRRKSLYARPITVLLAPIMQATRQLGKSRIADSGGR